MGVQEAFGALPLVAAIHTVLQSHRQAEEEGYVYLTGGGVGCREREACCGTVTKCD